MDELILESVPNFSTSDAAVLEEVVAAIEAAGARALDLHVDRDHNRSVVTVFGAADPLVEALTAAVTVAVAHIDLRRHEGVHPRVGACDVLPIVPLDALVTDGAALTAAIDVADRVAARLGESLAVPVLRYGAGGAGAFAGELRRGGLAAIGARLATGELVPQAGPAALHPSAGATIVGVREVLIAFNVGLEGDDLVAAREIADAIREVRGGLAGVRAMAVHLDRAGHVQVSTNVERYRDSGPTEVLRAVAAAASARGIRVRTAELVGLAPASAWSRLDAAARELGIPMRAAAEPTIEAAVQRLRDAAR